MTPRRRLGDAGKGRGGFAGAAACFAAAAMSALALIGATSASGAPGPVFSVVGATPALPSAEVPNASGSLALPPDWTAKPFVAKTMSFGGLNALWHRAGAAYGIPWEVLAAINKIESNFGRNMGPSSAGAVGWMQFMPSTWLRWGTDATGDGIADPWHPEDAVFSAARYLAAAGAREDLYRGVFAYNHADWYVRDVLDLAAVYGNGGGTLTFTLDRLQVELDGAREEVARANRALVEAVRAARAARRAERALVRKAAGATLISDRLTLERQAFQAGVRSDEAAALVESRREAVDTAKAALDAASASAGPATMTPGSANLLSSPQSAAGYSFPVGGGPSTVSVGHDHHDYPAADIAAPSGAPVYALTDGFVKDAWALPTGNCGIGFVLVAGDGREWTYCHLSFLEPSVVPGAALTGGASVGLVGSTGHSTGPHLHLQTGPELTYPQEEPWFQALAGIAFSWQDGGETQPWPVAPFSPVPVFAVVDEPVFEVVSAEGDVVEFTLAS
jgi:murein DD-endopeptidase MepM/ murein hydrolase activator NlpD